MPATLSLSTVNVTDISQQCVSIDELDQNGQYEVSVACFNAACLSPFSDSVQFAVDDDMMQTPPTNITAFAINSTSIRVTFLPPSFTGRSDLYYVISANRSVTDQLRRQNDSASVVRVSDRLLSDGMQTAVVNGLDKFTKYQLTVRCKTDAAVGPFSSTITVHTLDDGMLHSSVPVFSVC